MNAITKLFKKGVPCEYIESGTFQGGEEDVSKSGIDYDEECVAVSKKLWDAAKAELKAMQKNPQPEGKGE